MKWKKILIPVLVVSVLAAVAVGVYISMNPIDTTLEFTVRDAVSKSWVYDATFRLQDRVIRSHFQSDQGPVPQRFTHLKPGETVLEISAPSYEPVSKTLKLKRGKNRIVEPIDVVGLEIPSLTRFYVFESKEGNDIKCEIRPVSKDGPAVVNHPCLDIWMGARISVQMKNGVPVQEETELGSVRGEELFRGAIKWEFDPYPETVFRYSARIPGAGIKATQAPYWVIDYLIVVPNPKNTNRDEVNSILEKTTSINPEAVPEYLKPFVDQQKFTYYIPEPSWNMPGGVK